jgi:hypothetical protein
MKAIDYIIEHIPTMIRDEHVAGMKLTTLVALLNGYHESEVKKLNIPDVSKSVCFYCKKDGNNDV